VSAAAAVSLFIVHAEMTDLSSCAVLSDKHLPINDHAASYSCAKSNHDHILLARAASFPHLAESGNIGIVSDGSHKSCELFQLPFDLLVFPAEICTAVDNSIRCYRRRNPDSDTLDILFRDLMFLNLFFN